MTGTFPVKHPARWRREVGASGRRVPSSVFPVKHRGPSEGHATSPCARARFTADAPSPQAGLLPRLRPSDPRGDRVSPQAPRALDSSGSAPQPHEGLGPARATRPFGVPRRTPPRGRFHQPPLNPARTTARRPRRPGPCEARSGPPIVDGKNGKPPSPEAHRRTACDVPLAASRPAHPSRSGRRSGPPKRGAPGAQRPPPNETG